MSLLATIENLCLAFDGRCGVSVLNLETNETTQYHADEIFPTASVIKLAVLITLMAQCEAGDYTLTDPLMLRKADKIGGSGLLQFMTPGLVMPIRDWAFLMMNISDNTATNVLIDHVGLESIQTWLTTHGFDNVYLHRKIDFGALAKDQRHLGTATATGLTRLMTAVFRREVVSATACDEMLRMMDKVGSERVGRYLPFPVWGSKKAPNQQLRLAGKTGSFVGTRVQTAAVWQGRGKTLRGYILTVMTEGNPEPERWHVDAPGVLLIGRISQAIYEHIFNNTNDRALRKLG